MLRKHLAGLASIWLMFPHAPAVAHYLWIEPDAARHARLYFGEYQENLRETSEGRLNWIKAPQAWVIDRDGTRRATATSRQRDHFDLGPVAGAQATLVEDASGEVLDLKAYGYGVVRPFFYARYAATTAEAASPQLTLDIVPEKQPGRYGVYFRGRPLPRAKITVYAPNQWQQEHRADEQGIVQVATPWPGHYVLEVIHSEPQSGEFRGRAFEALRHRATLTIPVDGPVHAH